MAYDYLEVLGIEIGYISNGAYIPLRNNLKAKRRLGQTSTDLKKNSQVCFLGQYVIPVKRRSGLHNISANEAPYSVLELPVRLGMGIRNYLQ